MIEQETLMSHGKLDAIMTALASISLDHDQILKQNKGLNPRLHDLETQMHNAIGQVHAAKVSPPASLQQQAPTTSNNKAKEPQVNLPKKFDSTRLKFWGFVNQVQLITILQPQRYPTDATCVDWLALYLPDKHYIGSHHCLRRMQQFLATLKHFSECLVKHLVNMTKFTQPQRRFVAYVKAHDQHQIMLPSFNN